ncbi:MAG TPA: PAS domain S-box protein [Candidatus Latescibacteria bacterium]|nr:PAS domain S-box protein [Candidatus Latescibacterota bacterium]
MEEDEFTAHYFLEGRRFAVAHIPLAGTAAVLRGFARVLSMGFTRLEDLRELEARVRELAESEERYHSLRFIRKDGEERWAEIYAVRISYDGRPAVLGNFIDITERRRLEKEREQLRERLEQSEKLASIGELVAGVAHELNNPLTTVVGFADLTMRRTSDEGLRSQLRYILQEAQRAARIVQNLLTFARKQSLEQRVLNLKELLDGVLELRSYELRTANIEVVRLYAPEPVFVSGDLVQLQQVFINIIANAEQAMYEAHGGGKLTVQIKVQGEKALVHIQDDGPGIPMEVQKKIFDPFFTT